MGASATERQQGHFWRPGEPLLLIDMRQSAIGGLLHRYSQRPNGRQTNCCYGLMKRRIELDARRAHSIGHPEESWRLWCRVLQGIGFRSTLKMLFLQLAQVLLTTADRGAGSPCGPHVGSEAGGVWGRDMQPVLLQLIDISTCGVVAGR